MNESREIPDDLDLPLDPEDKETYEGRKEIFIDLWDWLEKSVYRTNRIKGWINASRRDGELIALIHSEVSEALEGLRHGNPPSEHIPEVSAVEEEFADVIIRLMDFGYTHKLNIAKALFIKMEYNKTRPYRHGGKTF